MRTVASCSMKGGCSYDGDLSKHDYNVMCKTFVCRNAYSSTATCIDLGNVSFSIRDKCYFNMSVPVNI